MYANPEHDPSAQNTHVSGQAALLLTTLVSTPILTQLLRIRSAAGIQLAANQGHEPRCAAVARDQLRRRLLILGALGC